MATNKSRTSYLIMLFRKKVKLFSLFISVLYSINLSSQPLNFSIEKVKSFDLRSVDANYDFMYKLNIDNFQNIKVYKKNKKKNSWIKIDG